MPKPKPTIVMVPGAWHKADIYSEVASNLKKYGYSTISLPLPSVGATPPHQNFDGDVAAIRKTLEDLVSEGKEVVLVVHSYTGLPGGDAPKDLGRKEREASGLEGGVIRYVVINGFTTPEGFRPAAEGDYSQIPDWMKIDLEKGVVNVLPEDAKRIFYNDLSSEQGDELAASLLPQSLGVYSSTASYAAWKDIPSTYLMGEIDQSAFMPEFAEMMIKGAQQAEPTAFDVIERCKEGGHCLMISFPKWTADALRRAAGESFQI